ncbi:hypothetical protein D3C76_1290090 [compost metagenome]
MVFHGLAHGPAEARTVGQVVGGAQRRDRDHLEVLVLVHVAHRYQGAVLRAQGGGVVGHGLDVEAVARFGQDQPQVLVARELVRHVADEVRQFIGGVDPLEVLTTEDVVVGIDQPVGVEHHNRVDPQLTAASADLVVPVDGGLPKALTRARQLGQVHAGHVSDFGCERHFTHDRTPYSCKSRSAGAGLLGAAGG